MEVAVQLVWWIGLIGALIPTLIILKEVALVLRTLGEIHRLATLTREAAGGVAANVAVVPSLAGLNEPVVQLRNATGAMVVAAAALERKLGG